MRIEIQHEAELILDTIRHKAAMFSDWDAVRDYCDIQTGGDLDCFQLDMLTDCVARRLRVSIA